VTNVTNQPAVGLATKPTLVGDKVILRPFSFEEDEAPLREMLSDPEALKLTGSYHDPDDPPAWDDAGEATFLSWYTTRNDQAERLDLAIVDKVSGRCVGEVAFMDWSEPNRSCSFRIMIGPGGRDRGLGTEAVRLFVGYGFEQLDLHRIQLDVHAFNPRARHVYEKVGFVAEGVLREEHRWADQWIDVTIMSILDREWEQCRGRP
jgi:RimJ/RimL family protein N-acetyltransferase